MGTMVRIGTWLDGHGVSDKTERGRYRRFVRHGNVASAQHLDNLGLWVIDGATPLPALPEPKQSGFAPSRTDGLWRHIVYTDAAGADKIRALGMTVICTRERARKRRIERKRLAAAAAKPTPPVADRTNDVNANNQHDATGNG